MTTTPRIETNISLARDGRPSERGGSGNVEKPLRLDLRRDDPYGAIIVKCEACNGGGYVEVESYAVDEGDAKYGPMWPEFSD